MHFCRDITPSLHITFYFHIMAYIFIKGNQIILYIPYIHDKWSSEWLDAISFVSSEWILKEAKKFSYLHITMGRLSVMVCWTALVKVCIEGWIENELVLCSNFPSDVSLVGQIGIFMLVYFDNFKYG